ncbi:hypothetical protein [Paraglaciecola psychrophila]|uniref:Sporulation related protein n=1 Tax=Paraglaciecola psychrophila 170 TaxID=1129794 RepID=K6ZQ54_9ALTE|nr:hypothetical protein [Paraglaciecola psychrophila]AGH45411.1 sporulation related protein [Paraglaciecola psychrophila 170]GAC38081.1 sporulation related [Paraglaciecola psychrophila 170]
MSTRYHCFACLLFIFSCNAASQPLKKLANIDFAQADFYLLDVADHNVKVAPSIDAYIHQGDLYIAITPLFEGLRLKYSLIGDKFSVTFADKISEFDFTEELANQGQWFNDGSFIFIKSEILEQLFATQITINTATLKMDLAGHTVDFPYKTIKNQQKQRKRNNYIIDRSDAEQQTDSGAIITIADEYRLATVPTGFASLEYQVNDKKERYDVNIQVESDLAYHSTSITLNHTENETNSRILLSRYPKFTGDKILGIWDTYSVGDLYLTQSSLTPGSYSRGLGINFSANVKGNFNENMTTSFAKTARPGWDADIYHNGIFLETRVVPADGLMEFNNMEVYYGANEFKIILYGPFGEQETLIEQVSVKNNSLGQGAYSYGLSLKENESSLLDVNLSEFDIDAISGRFGIGLFDNWQLGVSVDLNDIHNPNGGNESYRISNQITFPGWFFQNNISINSNNISQASSLATSFFNNDNFTLNYNSQWNEAQFDESSLDANYNIRSGPTTNSIYYSYDEFGSSKTERLQYRLSFVNKYVSASNSLSYIRKNENEDLFFGALTLSTRIQDNFRFLTTIPYDINGEDSIETEQISASVLYNYRHGAYNHTFNASNRSFFKENLWSVGYNLAINKPTHQLTLRTQYNSQEKWAVTAGIAINFGYDYFNNEMQFSSQTLRGAGSLDVHTYLDRQLNGIPDVLDYNLAGVTFSGGPYWENEVSNQDGQTRLFRAKKGITALRANWESGSATLNNDYMIYSHPGSLQRVNLPFYLTTEVELFVLLSGDSQAVTLSNVPLIASNVSSGDEYALETDFDGYASFVNLLPGKYSIYVDKEYLRDKGLQAEIAGFEFNSPLRGGFVVLPNIELSRSESGEIGANKLLSVMLDENNYEPLFYTDNDKLIHLPPKGGMKAPYSSDKLELALFKEIKMQSTEQERKELRAKLAAAAEGSQQFQPFSTQPTSPPSVGTIVASSQETLEVFETAQEGIEDLEQLNPVVVLSPLKPENVVEDQVPTPSSNDNVPTQDTNTEQAGEKLDLNSGFVIQFSALKSLAIATALAETFPNTKQLHIVRKLVKGESFYCLISRVLPDRSAATEYLKTAEKEGFIVDATSYLEPIWSK